ncbi:hypothetical protein ACWIYZ_07770 [Ursidibacter arcticus]
MIDIKSELLAIEKKREQDFISIIELLDFLKEHNPNASFPEIATYLLIKLEPHNIRKTDEELWLNEEFEQWEDEHGINTYKMPKSISDNPAPLTTSYFITALETVRYNEPDPLWDNPTAGAFLREEQKDLFIDRKQIETILGIDTLNKNALTKKFRDEEYLAVAMALTKTDEFVKNTDINKSPVGLAERLVMQQEINQKSDQITQLQARIAELEKELAEKTITPQEETTQRISQAQRDIFTLLTIKNYPDCQSRHHLFNSINAELKSNGITTKDIKYTTLDRLIDENIRVGSPIRSPFPPKQK